jgi:putative phosphonate metabolism protein
MSDTARRAAPLPSDPGPRPAAAHAAGPARYALYYAPPRHSPWWRIGCEWLQRDPQTGASLAPPAVAGLGSQPLAELTSAPRGYGWHATLYPPFACAPGIAPADVLASAMRWAARQTPFALPVTAGTLGGCVALCPADAPAATAVAVLAAAAVPVFHPLRAKPDAAELARRSAHDLSPRQQALLEKWGYPFVLDEYRFHMTLSNRIAAAHADALLAWWRPRLAQLGPLPIDGAALFTQSGPGAPFVLWHRLPFENAA